MHTLLIHQAFISPNEAGGTRHFELARALVREGEQFTIVASTLSYLTGRAVAEPGANSGVQVADGVQVLRAYTYPSLHRSFVWRIVTFFSFMLSSIVVALRAGRVDVVMGTSPPIFQAVSAWLVAAARRKPFLLEIRDLWPAFAIDLGILRNPLLIKLSRWLERFLYARATHLIVNSPAYREYLMEQGIAHKKISLIPNGVDSTMFDPQSRGESIREQWNLGTKFVVTYAGALGMANDIPTILRAAQRLTNDSAIHFLLVGDGKERGNLEALARELRLKNVTFTGSVAKSLMPDVLAASDSCVATLQDIPMFRTTYPNKVFDYMAAGRPTILAIDGVIRQVIDEVGGGLFVPPGDDAALAEAIRRLSSDRELVRAMGWRARQHVVANFDRQKQAAEFGALVRQIAAGTPVGGA